MEAQYFFLFLFLLLNFWYNTAVDLIENLYPKMTAA